MFSNKLCAHLFFLLYKRNHGANTNDLFNLIVYLTINYSYVAKKEN